MTFFVFKSYDGGRTWEQARRCADFATAATAAEALRSAHPMIRFRIDVEAPGRPDGRASARARRRSHRRRTSLSARK